MYEKELVDLITRWSSNKIAFPASWSENKQLDSYPISYRTYNGGGEYCNIELTLGGTVEYSINLRYGEIEVVHSLSNPLSAKKALELVKTVYEEAISMESIVEGKASMREEVAKKKKQAKELIKEATKLEMTLINEEK